MEKKLRVNVYLEDSARICSHLKDFKGTVEDWKNAVYELFRFNMTYSVAYRIDVLESRTSGVFVSLTINPEYEENVDLFMKSLGFTGITIEHEDIGKIDCTDLPDDALIDYVEIEY